MVYFKLQIEYVLCEVGTEANVTVYFLKITTVTVFSVRYELGPKTFKDLDIELENDRL
jgi:hypothetical protein